MPIDYNNYDYLSPDNEINKKYANLSSNCGNGQVQYICNKVTILARRLDDQYQQYDKTINKTFLEETFILLSKLEQLQE